MQIRRIEVRNFRKLRHVLIEDLQDGLNVVVGDNEAGKSTLLAALRAALFEKHRVSGSAAEAMQPFGQTVRPEVALDFDLDGQPWSLHKAFCQRPEATLIGPGERITGEDVEDRLAQLFGFVPAGRGGSNPEKNQGAYGLLWVEQGAAHRSLGVGAGRESIASALESEVGQVLGGERGRALLSAAEGRRNAFWSKIDKPRGDWKSLRDEVKDLEEEIAELERQHATYDGKIDDLDRRLGVVARHKSEDRLNKAVRDLEAASLAMAETAKLEQVLREAMTRCKLAASERDAAQVRTMTRRKLVERLEAARRALADAMAGAEQMKGLLETRGRTVAKASERLTGCRSALNQAAALALAAEQALERQRARADLAAAEGQLVLCEEAERKRREAVAASQGIAVTEAILREVSDLQKKVDQARAQLEAASVRIAFAPDGDRVIHIDGARHDAGAPVLLASDADVVLEGFGRLTIQPGGGVGLLAERLDLALRALERRLQALGLTDVAQAGAEWQRKLQRQQEADAHKALVAAIAPRGIDALRQTVDTLRATVEAPLPDLARSLCEVDDRRLAEARRLRDAATAEAESAESEVRTAERARAAAEQDWATHRERGSGLGREREALEGELAEARAAASDDQLAQDLAAADRVLAGETLAETRARADLDAADPEIVKLKLDRAREAEKAIRKDIDTLEREVRDLRIELSALGREGVGERLADLRGQLELKRKHLAAQDQEAEAALLLHDVLTSAQRESKDRWLGPVRKRVEPYLRILQPQTDVVLDDESLELQSFVRDGQHEPFESLSMGAREQVAVVTRLALADILRSSNLPSAVILDDALVNSKRLAAPLLPLRVGPCD